MSKPYIACCSRCGVVTHAPDAFDVISVQKWKFEIQRNRNGKIVDRTWQCPTCKKKGRRQSQAPQA